MAIEGTPFDELLSFVVDNRGRTCPTADHGLPLIATNCISNDRLYPSKENVRYVDGETYSKWFRAHPQPGDIIFVLKGAPGRCCLAPDPVDFCIAQDMVALRADSEKVDPFYLFAALRSPRIQASIQRLHVGTMIPHFKKGDFHQLVIPIPNRDAQRFIGTAYIALLEKIELNRRMSETLDAMALAVFKDWFVDFGPTRCKQMSGTRYLSEDIWKLFPERFDDSGKPEGWSEKRIDDILELAYGQALKASERVEGPIPVYGSGGITGYHNQAVVDGPSVIVGRKGTVGSLYWEDGPFFPIDTVFFVKAKVPLSFCYYRLRTLGLAGMNTDAAVPGLNRNNVYRLGVPWGSSELLATFNEVVAPLRDAIKANSFEMENLAKVRDLLLPKLISSDIHIKEAEQIAGSST